jgi:hypothetical protein
MRQRAGRRIPDVQVPNTRAVQNQWGKRQLTTDDHALFLLPLGPQADDAATLFSAFDGAFLLFGVVERQLMRNARQALAA